MLGVPVHVWVFGRAYVLLMAFDILPNRDCTTLHRIGAIDQSGVGEAETFGGEKDFFG